jgi:hypothetical protein
MIAEGRDTPKDNPGTLLHGKKDECRGTLLHLEKSTGDENANLYIRGMSEDRYIEVDVYGVVKATRQIRHVL